MATIIKIEVVGKEMSAESRQSIRALMATGVSFLVEVANGATYAVAGIFEGKLALIPDNCNTESRIRGLSLEFPA